MITVRVPATSANIGPGFDSMGVALTLYNYVKAEEIGDGLQINITDDSSKFLARDEKNLVYRSMKAVFDKVGYRPKGIHLELTNNIMVTRGLGSSSAGIVGGLLAGNALSGRKLSQEQLLDIANKIEGHPDNVTPALLGGLTVSVPKGGHVSFVKAELKNDLTFAALVPNFFLQTKKSRSLLPKFVPHRDAVYNEARTALLFASLTNGKYENIPVAIGDRLHQRYRKRLIPHMEDIFNACYANGALGVYLSGAGPTIIAILDEKNQSFQANITQTLKKSTQNWQLHMLKADNEGAAEI